MAPETEDDLNSQAAAEEKQPKDPKPKPPKKLKKDITALTWGGVGIFPQDG